MVELEMILVLTLPQSSLSMGTQFLFIIKLKVAKTIQDGHGNGKDKYSISMATQTVLAREQAIMWSVQTLTVMVMMNLSLLSEAHNPGKEYTTIKPLMFQEESLSSGKFLRTLPLGLLLETLMEMVVLILQQWVTTYLATTRTKTQPWLYIIIDLDL